MRSAFYTTLVFFFGILLTFLNATAQDVSEQEHQEIMTSQRTIYIYKFTDYIEWPEFKKLDVFKIGVLGADELPLVAEFKKMENNRTVRGKAIVIEHFKTVDEITKTQILYVNKASGFDIYKVLKKTSGNNTLLVSENYAFHKSMINFIDVDGEFKFELHEKKITDEKLVVSPALKSYSIESTADWYELYLKTELSLEEEKKKVEKQQREIDKQMEEIELQNKKIIVQNQQISKQKEDILAQQKKLESQKAKLSLLFHNIEEQEKKLQSQVEILKKQEAEIEKQKHDQLLEMEQHLDRLIQQKAAIIEAENKINAQNDILNEQLAQIETQKLMLYMFIAMFVLILISVFYIYRGYKIKKEANKKLEEKNIAISKQKEQIEKSYDNVAVLGSIGQKITSTLDLETILNTVHQAVAKLMDTTAFAVGVYNDKKQQIEYILFSEKGEMLEAPPVPMSNKNSLAIWCAENKKEVFINDVENEYTNYAEKIFVAEGEMPESVIYLPLMVEERIIGVITTQSFTKNAYTNYHLDMLRTLATYTAIALNNAEVYEDLNAAHKIVEEKNEDITASIRYAKKIQEAILPNEDEIKEAFSDMFLFYEPRDIVSGDFYWFLKVNGVSIVAAADCTGHGVPAALITMVGIELLNQILPNKTVKSPAHALKALDEGIKKALKQVGEAEEYESMDMALCALHHDKNLLEYSGAYRPLYLIRKGELIEYTADKFSVGGYSEKKQFNNHEIQLEKGDAFYIFSDGFPDQFGGKKGKKFMVKRFKKTILDMQNMSMKKQHDHLKKTIDEWKGDEEQVDDMVVIGVQV